jgi:hypothetical protein
MSVGRDASAERRRTRERTLIHEGEALWRAKQRHTWIAKLQEQREVSQGCIFSVALRLGVQICMQKSCFKLV